MAVKNIKIIINHNPVSEKRCRSGKHGFYNPLSKEKTVIRTLIKSICNKKDYTYKKNNSYTVYMTFYFGMLKSWSKKKQKEMENQQHTKKPDLDNISKFYLDCMNGVCYHDDSEICDLVARKYFSKDPRVEIVVFPRRVNDI